MSWPRSASSALRDRENDRHDNRERRGSSNVRMLCRLPFASAAFGLLSWGAITPSVQDHPPLRLSPCSRVGLRCLNCLLAIHQFERLGGSLQDRCGAWSFCIALALSQAWYWLLASHSTASASVLKPVICSCSPFAKVATRCQSGSGLVSNVILERFSTIGPNMRDSARLASPSGLFALFELTTTPPPVGRVACAPGERIAPRTAHRTSLLCG